MPQETVSIRQLSYFVLLVHVELETAPEVFLKCSIYSLFRFFYDETKLNRTFTVNYCIRNENDRLDRLFFSFSWCYRYYAACTIFQKN